MDPLAQAIWGGIIVGVAFTLWLTSDSWGPSVKRSARSVESHHGAAVESAARTGAEAEEKDAPHQDAGADEVRGAVRGAHPGDLDGSLVLSVEETAAVARMVRHKVAVPTATKFDTIKAGWPEIRGKSGDPNSKYARAAGIYEAVFTPPPDTTPIVGRPVPQGTAFIGEPNPQR
jgi:hypothetical protein